MSTISIRKIIKNGQTYEAFIDDFKEVRRTSFNIQAKFHGNKLKIFEINPRFSATCPMRAAAGINEPDIVFRNFVLGEDIKTEGYQRLVCMRYWNEVYTPYSTYVKTLKTGRVEANNKSFILNYF